MKDIFIERLKYALEFEGNEIHMEDEFRDYDEWSSIAYLSVIAMLDEEYEIQIEEKDFKKIKTVRDMYNLTKEV